MESEIDRLIEEQMPRVPSKAEELYDRAQEVLAENQPMIFLANGILGAGKNVRARPEKSWADSRREPLARGHTVSSAFRRYSRTSVLRSADRFPLPMVWRDAPARDSTSVIRRSIARR